MAIPPEVSGHYQPNNANAEFPYWAKMATWSVHEASAVLVGLNPHFAKDHTLGYGREANKYAVRFYGLLELARRAWDQSEIDYPATPANWLDWAKKRDLPIFPVLEKEIDRWRTFKTPGETIRIGELEAKNARLESDLSKAKSADAQSIGARERDSVLKLIIGMAVAGYKYDPLAQKNDAIRDITGDLEKHGVPLADDTIRKYLRAGADLLPPKSKDL